jgi:DAACS family dicarboxylate/amino acid:cation (Na+ or H+) symporter
MAESRKHGPSHWLILLGLLLGAVAGVVANGLAAASPQIRSIVDWLADAVAHPIGQVFLRLLFVAVVPLVFASLAGGVARLGDYKKLGLVGARTLAFFLLTSAFSVVLGIAAMRGFAPGSGFDPLVRAELMEAFAGDAARYQEVAEARAPETLRGQVDQVLDSVLPRNVLDAVVRMQMLPLIAFSLLFGAALTALAESRRRLMLDWLDALADAMVAIVTIAMRLAPAAVFCLIFAVTARFGFDVLGKLSLFVALVLGAYLVQLFVLYPLLVRILGRRRPGSFLRQAVPVMATAFSTSSSNATLPTSIRVAETEMGVRPAVAGFVLPLGATMNMNGTALFEGAVVLFLAQIFGVELSLLQQAQVVVLCVLASVGAAGVPGGSLPLLMIVLHQFRVPPEGIAIVLGVDRLLDMGRTVVNVTGDLACATYVEAVERRATLPVASTPTSLPIAVEAEVPAGPRA